MAYIPDHVADVFISYCHEDDCAWIERFQQDLYTMLTRKLRARTRPTVFFDARDLRAGRTFDAEIADKLAQTGFFVAMVSPKYNASTYCRHKELAAFLRRHSPESGRLIQVQLDSSAALPVDKSLAVSFFNARGPFRPDSDDYQDALRRVYEPIVCELDRLYAESKMVFLAWPGESALEEERKRLELEIEGRGLRIFPEVVAEYESEIRLRDALQKSMTSVHLFGEDPRPFDVRQWDEAVRMGRPCILASCSATEGRRGPAGSPPPIYLEQGNPTIAVARAVEQVAQIGKRDEGDGQRSLGRMPVFLIFKADSDAILGIQLRKRIPSCGPFEVVVLPGAGARYEGIDRAKAVVLCRAKAGRDWFASELSALNAAMASSRQDLDLLRALLLPVAEDLTGLDLLPDDSVLDSTDALDGFLTKLKGTSA
jgi:hypothetical protein